MKVLVLYDHCSPHQVTAVETAYQVFRQKGYELIPLEFYFGSIEYTWTMKDKHRPSHWVCLYPNKRNVSTYQLFRDLRRKVKALRIDVVVINGWYGRFAWLFVMLKRWIGCRIVLISDSGYCDNPRLWHKELPKKLFLRGVDAGFVAGAPQAEYLQSLGMAPERMSKGADVVDNSLYFSLPIREKPASRKIVIGTAARLVQKKNLAAAMRAFGAVVHGHPELQLEWRIAGQGPLEESLRQLAHELRVPVVFQGFVGYDNMPGFYQQLALYWQPSLSEPWGLVVNEAMAAGLPVLVSDHCGCSRDLVTPENGWIHDISHDGMVHGLERALNERDVWPDRGRISRELIKQWDVMRFSEGLLQACQIAFKGSP